MRWLIDTPEDYRRNRLALASGRRIDTTGLVLATGFGTTPPDSALVDHIACEYGLARDALGYPAVMDTLEWAPGLFVAGRLAELALGPAAGNLAGARMAGQWLRDNMP